MCVHTLPLSLLLLLCVSFDMILLFEGGTRGLDSTSIGALDDDVESGIVGWSSKEAAGASSLILVVSCPAYVTCSTTTPRPFGDLVS